MAFRHLSSIEPLEARIAPAIIFNYIDVDGDKVKVTISAGHTGDADFTLAPMGMGNELQTLNLHGNAVFKGATITVSAIPFGGHGDGLANVGLIDATGLDLHSVTVGGDLARIEAGDANLATPGLGLLNVHSFRSLGAGPLETTAGKLSHVQGALTNLRVTADMGAGLTVGSLGVGVIGGSLIGASDPSVPGELDYSGNITSTGDIGTVIVRGDVRGGAGVDAGSILTSGGKIGTVEVFGSVFGGSGTAYAGSVYALGNIGSLIVLGDVLGGSGAQSGYLSTGASGVMTNVKIMGSLVGGSGHDSGEIYAGNVLSSLYIGGALRGGNNSGSALHATGYVQALRILSANIGSLIAGTDDGSGLIQSGAIYAVDDLVRLTVRHDVTGNSTNDAYIGGYGAPQAGTTDVAIGSVYVGGTVSHAEILAGFDIAIAGQPRGDLSNGNGSAQIGTVTVIGNWIASSVSAGVDPGADGKFGTADDVAMPKATSIISTIASVVLRGAVVGSASSNDTAAFGFVAEHVTSVKIGLGAVPLLSGASNDTFASGHAQAIGSSLGTLNADGFDVHVAEVA